MDPWPDSYAFPTLALHDRDQSTAYGMSKINSMASKTRSSNSRCPGDGVVQISHVRGWRKAQSSP